MIERRLRYLSTDPKLDNYVLEAIEPYKGGLAGVWLVRVVGLVRPARDKTEQEAYERHHPMFANGHTMYPYDGKPQRLRCRKVRRLPLP